MLAFKETNKPVHNAKQISLFQRKSPGEKTHFPVVHTGVTYPSAWSTLVPKCWFSDPTAKFWGRGGRFGEIWTVGPQDKWSWQLLKTYLKILRVGSHFWVTKNCTESRLLLLTIQRANKSRGSLLGQGIVILFGKPGLWEDGRLVSLNTVLLGSDC